jgi:cytoskeletal protein CcmA (bactofilin family)
MTEMRIRSIDESTLQTVLAEDIDFDGEIHFSEPLLIKGNVKGKVISDTDLYINADALVAARIEAKKVSVKGEVKGDIFATDRLELFASARVEGNVHTPDLIVQSGCKLNGSCTMPAETAAPSASDRGAGEGRDDA